MLEFRNVTVKRGKFTLSNINFQLKDGYLLGILGENGAGKTTLLNSMMERHPNYTGDIFYQGIDIQKEPEWFLEKCAYIADDNRFFNKKTAMENVELLSGFYGKMDKEKFKTYMDEMKLSYRKQVGAMSRGQFIRFQIAFARAHHAKLYLLDEATAGMDPVFRREFYNILRQILAEEATILMTTHIQSDIDRNVDYICRLEHGKMVFFQENFGEKGNHE